MRQAQPSFDWMKANSFQLNAAVTEGNDVMPSSTDNAYATTPYESKYIIILYKYVNKPIHVKIITYVLNAEYLIMLPATKKLSPLQCIFSEPKTFTV